MAFDGVTWAEGAPDNDTVAHQIDDYMRDVKIGIRSRMAREHIFPAVQAATNEGGHHNYITLQMQTAAPTLAATSAGAIYIGSSASGYPLMFENSAGTAITVVNSAGKLAVVSGGTQGSIVICSSANPTSAILLAGSADNYVLVTHAATAAPTWVDPNTLITGQFGAWVDKSSDYGAQQAATDGFVIVKSAAGGSFSIKTDSSSTPATIRAYTDGAVTNQSAMTPVKKGDYWMVSVVSGTPTVYWIPMGA